MMAEAEFTMPAAPAVGGRKPKTSVYVVLLAIAFLALLLGCLFLYLEIKAYGGFGTVRGQISQVAPSLFNGQSLSGGAIESLVA